MADELNPDNEFPWPTEGDDPFKLTASARQLMACLNFTHDEPWYGIAEGFNYYGAIPVQGSSDSMLNFVGGLLGVSAIDTHAAIAKTKPTARDQ